MKIKCQNNMNNLDYPVTRIEIWSQISIAQLSPEVLQFSYFNACIAFVIFYNITNIEVIEIVFSSKLVNFNVHVALL